MPKSRRKTESSARSRDPLPVKSRKQVPHEFVLDALSSLSPWTRPMFGCVAIYVEEKIVLILRDRPSYPTDNGVWLATTVDHHQSLSSELPNMRSIRVFGKEITGWQVLPVDAPDFEESALHACDLVLAGDPRIGKVPGEKKRKSKLQDRPVHKSKSKISRRR
jgi:hypothetical protein